MQLVNVSETSNWLISWIITLQYDTTVDQLKTIRNQIEDHINKSEDFNTSIGVAVRVDKFSDSSIDMYVRCFTKSDSWNEWLSVKERLAIEIKQIVESNKASFAFPSHQFILKKNDSYFLFSFTNIKTLFLCSYSQCIVSWLIAFNILNTQNRFVYSILELKYRLTDPILKN